MVMECRNFWIIPDLQIEFKLHRDWNMLSTKIQLAYKVQRERIEFVYSSLCPCGGVTCLLVWDKVL